MNLWGLIRLFHEMDDLTDEFIQEGVVKNGLGFSPEVLDKFRETADTLMRAKEMIKQVDRLLCVVDNEKAFLKTWNKNVRPPWKDAKCVARKSKN